YQSHIPNIPQESGDDEYRGEHSDSDDEVDSDFDIDEGDEPGSEQDEAEPRRRRRVLTKAYREPLKSLRAKKVEGSRGGSQKSREVKSVPLELQEDVGDSEDTGNGTRTVGMGQGQQEWDKDTRNGTGTLGMALGQWEWDREWHQDKNYERLEADKKKQVQKKRKIVGPVIRYWSLTMPLLPEPGRDDPVDVEGLGREKQLGAPESHGKSSLEPPHPMRKTGFGPQITWKSRFWALNPGHHLGAPNPNSHRRIIREAYRKYITAHGLPSAAAAAATGAAGGAGDGAGARPGRQKIVIKQSVPTS
ncbi:VPS72 protein, partial [Melanocharis versteri]|nr:VPS72 protein [Melanocharis versteri]